MARLPFLQVPMEAFPRARMLARYLGQHEAAGIGLYVMLDEWALSAPPELTAEGVLVDPEPAEVLACALRWQGDTGELLSALLRSKIVEKVADGFRLLGWEKYTKALAGKSSRSAASAKAASERWGRKNDASRMADASSSHNERMPTPCVVDAKTQTQTQKEETASQATASAAPGADGEELPDATEDAQEVRPALVLEAQQPEKPGRRQSAGEALYARLEARRQEACRIDGVPFVESRWAHSRQNRELGPLAKTEKADAEGETWKRFVGAWLAFMEDDEAAKLDVPYSLDYFWRMRSRYEGRALRGAA